MEDQIQISEAFDQLVKLHSAQTQQLAISNAIATRLQANINQLLTENEQMKAQLSELENKSK